ncbi:MAG: hypothetical protein JWM62_1519 [Frankiales bacterium]|nr:hypothetical protein [Frankiales bacterium]
MGDRGDIVLGWLTKLVLTLGVLGVIGFDLVSLGAARFQAEDHAQAAVRAADESWESAKDLQTAYDAALAEVLEHGDSIDPQTFTVGQDGSITLTLHRTAPTMLVKKIGPARNWAEVDVTVSARPAS